MDFSWFSTDIGTYVLYGAIGGAIGGVIGAGVQRLSKSKFLGNLCVVVAIALAAVNAHLHLHPLRMTIKLDLPAPASGVSHAAKPKIYSVRELRQAPPMPEGTEVHLHALLWQGEHSMIVQDERCGDMCEDILHFDGATPEAQTEFDAARPLLGDALGCCNSTHAYFDMMVTVRYVDHVPPIGVDSAGPIHGLAAVRMTKLISATADTPAHWRATHPG